MQIKRIVSNLLCSNMYIVSESGHAMIIDPCVCEPDISGVKVDLILLTHEHYDHISGVNYWKEKTGAPLLCSESCADGCRNPVKNISRYFSLFCELQTWVKQPKIPACGDYACAADQPFKDKYRLSWQGHEITLFECPGHSAGGTMILIDDNALFSGDSIIKGHPIACSMPGGSRKQWSALSLPRLARLDPAITVYPGHFDSLCLAEHQLI